MNILYIEDNVNDSTLVERYLKTTDHRLVIAPTIAAAERLVQEADLILMDILIGQERVGVQYLRRLRQAGVTCPVVAVTALVLPDDILSYQKARFDAILRKPFEIRELADVVERFDRTRR
jgi:CheY-like chemotaxis protein